MYLQVVALAHPRPRSAENSCWEVGHCHILNGFRLTLSVYRLLVVVDFGLMNSIVVWPGRRRESA